MYHIIDYIIFYHYHEFSKTQQDFYYYRFIGYFNSNYDGGFTIFKYNVAILGKTMMKNKGTYSL